METHEVMTPEPPTLPELEKTFGCERDALISVGAGFDPDFIKVLSRSYVERGVHFRSFGQQNHSILRNAPVTIYGAGLKPTFASKTLSHEFFRTDSNADLFHAVLGSNLKSPVDFALVFSGSSSDRYFDLTKLLGWHGIPTLMVDSMAELEAKIKPFTEKHK